MSELSDKQEAMRQRMQMKNYVPIPDPPKTLIPRKRYAPRRSALNIRRRVISVGPWPEGGTGWKKLTLECGHFALNNSENAPYSAECHKCKALGVV